MASTAHLQKPAQGGWQQRGLGFRAGIQGCPPSSTASSILPSSSSAPCQAVVLSWGYLSILILRERESTLEVQSRSWHSSLTVCPPSRSQFA